MMTVRPLNITVNVHPHQLLSHLYVTGTSIYCLNLTTIFLYRSISPKVDKTQLFILCREKHEPYSCLRLVTYHLTQNYRLGHTLLAQ